MALPSISSLFGGPAQNQQPMQPQNNQNNNQQQNQQPSPGNMENNNQQQNNTNTAPNGTTPGAGNTNNSNEATKNPLDAFKDLWETPKTDPNAPIQENMFNVDPVKLREAAGKVDFSQVVTPDVRAAIAKGGEEGVAASLNAMNSMSQTLYAQSALATTKIVERAINEAHSKWNADLPGHIKRHNVGNSLREENPALNHEAVKPLTSALEAQFVQKFPNATAAEINAMAKDYLKQTFQAVFPDMKETPKEAPGAKKKPAETNWDEFLEMN